MQFAHEIGGFEGAFGLQYISKDFDAVGEEAFISTTDIQNVALFVYETKELQDGFGIEGGTRIASVRLDNVDFGTRDYDLISGSFGVHRHHDSNLFYGAQLSYTERAPSESELFAFGPHLATNQFEVGNANLSKETGLNLEGTVRWQGSNGGFGVNLFVTEFDDFIFLAPGVTTFEGEEVDEADELPVFLFVQDDASFFGGEIYAGYTLEDGFLGATWRFDGSVDFVEADLDGVDGNGNVPFIPPVTLNAGVKASLGAWKVGADVTVAADQDDPGAGQLETDGYTTLDLRAAYDLSGHGIGEAGTNLFVEARNVTDEEVRYATSTLKELTPAPGQNVRVGLRLTF